MKKLLLICLLAFSFSKLIAQKQSYRECVNLAEKNFIEKNYDEAIKFIDLAIAKKPKTAENYFFKGKCFFRQKKHKEAIEAFNKAIALNPKNSLYFRYRGDSYYNLTNYELALQDYNKAIELDETQKNDTLFWYRGDTYRELERYQEAIRDYDKALALNDKNTEVFYHRAYMYALLRDSTKACNDYQKAYEMGMIRAKKEAFDLAKCIWARPAIEKDNSPVAISKVEVEPFTGAVIVSRGLKYEKYEFVPEKQMGFITGAVFGFNESFVFKVYAPKGFREDENGRIFFGAGFGIYEKEKELAGVQDLFADNYEGVDAEKLSNLRITLHFTKLLETGKTYTLKVKFFDKKSNAAIDMQLPFTMAEKTLQRNFINTTSSTLGLGVESKSTNQIDVRKIVFFEKGKVVSNLKADANYQLQLSEIANLSEDLNVRYAWVSAKDGLMLHTEKLSTKLDKSKSLLLNLVSPKQKGGYIFWLYLSAKENPSHIWAVSYPISVL